jgi:sec-independent protein translocase protein TatA
MIALFPGVPGGPELLVVLLLLVALFGLPVVIAVLGWRYLGGGGRVDDLETRVRELESELDRADAGESDDASADVGEADDASADVGEADDADSNSEADADGADDADSRHGGT